MNVLAEPVEAPRIISAGVDLHTRPSTAFHSIVRTDFGRHRTKAHDGGQSVRADRVEVEVLRGRSPIKGVRVSLAGET